MPKQKITKEMIVEAAFELARKKGLENVTVRDIAGSLNCSVQPVYSYCKSMEGLRKDVMEHAGSFIQEYIEKHLDKTDFFRSMGQTYIRLAKEERHIFRMFIMHERDYADSMGSLYEHETNPQVARFIADTLSVSVSKARQLHYHMLIYTMGIGTILSSAPAIDKEEVSGWLEQAYQAFLRQILEDREGGNSNE